MSGSEPLWSQKSMAGMDEQRLLGGGGQHLDTEGGYGLPIGTRSSGRHAQACVHPSTAATTGSDTGCRCRGATRHDARDPPQMKPTVEDNQGGGLTTTKRAVCLRDRPRRARAS